MVCGKSGGCISSESEGIFSCFEEDPVVVVDFGFPRYQMCQLFCEHEGWGEIGL